MIMGSIQTRGNEIFSFPIYGKKMRGVELGKDWAKSWERSVKALGFLCEIHYIAKKTMISIH